MRQNLASSEGSGDKAMGTSVIILAWQGYLG